MQSITVPQPNESIQKEEKKAISKFEILTNKASESTPADAAVMHLIKDRKHQHSIKTHKMARVDFNKT